MDILDLFIENTHQKPFYISNEFHCPLCGRNAVVSRENDKDWINISCTNPNCLNPRTGWNTESLTVQKWLKWG